jgi:hypothetical protein
MAGVDLGGSGIIFRLADEAELGLADDDVGGALAVCYARGGRGIAGGQAEAQEDEGEENGQCFHGSFHGGFSNLYVFLF